MGVAATFQSYLSSLELTEREQAEAARQQEALRERLRGHLAIEVSRLVGSYHRGTAIRPLKDIDVFVVLDPRRHRREGPEAPLRLLQEIERALRAGYPQHQPRIQGRSVNIEFSGTEIAYDIVPAFAPSGTGAGAEPPYYEIPDRRVSRWIRTNPLAHREACVAANARAGDMLNGLIKAAKHWNRANGKPLSSFHIEVMSYSAFGAKPADPRTGLRDLFRHLASAVQFDCQDPAHLGRPIDADLTPQERASAREQLLQAERIAAAAVEAERWRDDDAAIRGWRSLLGDGFR